MKRLLMLLAALGLTASFSVAQAMPVYAAVKSEKSVMREIPKEDAKKISEEMKDLSGKMMDMSKELGKGKVSEKDLESMEHSFAQLQERLTKVEMEMKE